MHMLAYTMYVDNTALMTESKEGLQDILDILHTYCKLITLNSNGNSALTKIEY
jgi:hypothetical protein